MMNDQATEHQPSRPRRIEPMPRNEIAALKAAVQRRWDEKPHYLGGDDPMSSPGCMLRAQEVLALIAAAEATQYFETLHDIKAEAYQREAVPNSSATKDALRGTALALSARLSAIERMSRNAVTDPHHVSNVSAVINQNRTMIARWKEIVEDGPEGNEPLGNVVRKLEHTTELLAALIGQEQNLSSGSGEVNDA